MLGKKYISILFVFLVAVALCTATGAVAGTSCTLPAGYSNYSFVTPGSCSPNDSTGHSTDEINACACSISADGWVTEIIPGTSAGHAGEFPVYCSGTDTSPECIDKKGNPIFGYRFAYFVTAPSGATVVQADVLASNTCNPPITKTYPTDQSVKFLLRDPNTGYAGGTSDFVIAWTGLKLDPANKTNFSVYTTWAGAGPQGMQVQTGTGVEGFDNLLGPSCCGETGFVTGFTLVGGSSVQFNACTGDLTSTSLTPIVGGSLWICWANLSTPSVLSSCDTIKRMGPAFGGFIDVSWDKVNPNHTSNQTYSGTRYYGYGSRFFEQTGITGQFPTACTGGTTGLFEQTMVFDNKAVVSFNACGDPISVTHLDGTPFTQVQLYVFVSSKNPSKMNSWPSDGGPIVNSGPTHGTMMEGSFFYQSIGWGGF